MAQQAKDLQIGDKVDLGGGTFREVVNIIKRTPKTITAVYRIEEDDDHRVVQHKNETSLTVAGK